MTKDLPTGFVERMKMQLGDEAESFFESLQLPSPVSIRMHPVKGRNEFTHISQVPWCETGYYLESRPSFHIDPHWHGGAYYVQEASSMILDFVLQSLSLQRDMPKIWMDICAAPGGKTGILANHMARHDVLVANEVISQRRAILRENLIKGGYLNTFVTGEPSGAFNKPVADIMLVDAPCAGEGMMRKDPEAIAQWSPGLIDQCALMQRNILVDVIQGVKEEGYLIYSTCSYSYQENIDNVAKTINTGLMESVEIPFPEIWNIDVIRKENATGYQLYPHRHAGEGLFISVMRKTGSTNRKSVSQKRKPSVHFSSLPLWLVDHLSDSDLKCIEKDKSYTCIHASAVEPAIEILELLPKADNIAGMGELKGKDFIPNHYMTMSGLAHEKFKRVPLGYTEALDYLERQTRLPEVQDTGWYRMSYNATVLGWAKYTPQGWKNHYPLNWRLRSR